MINLKKAKKKRSDKPIAPLTGVSYGRRSTFEQRDNTSRDNQIDSTRAYAKHNAIELVAECFDEMTGTTWSRPELWRALQLVRCLECPPVPLPARELEREDFLQDCACGRNAGADALIVWDLKRLGRDMQEMVFLVLDVLEPAGKHLIAVDGQMRFDTRTPIGKFFFSIIAGLAEYDRDEILDKLARGKRASIAQGNFGGGKAPFGWDGENSRFTPNKEEQRTLREVFYWAAQGLSTRQISDRLLGINHVKVHRMLDMDGPYANINAEKRKLGAWAERCRLAGEWLEVS